MFAGVASDGRLMGFSAGEWLTLLTGYMLVLLLILIAI